MLNAFRERGVAPADALAFDDGRLAGLRVGWIALPEARLALRWANVLSKRLIKAVFHFWREESWGGDGSVFG